MNGQSIGWDESSPQETEVLGLGNDRIMSVKTSARIALDDEHAWPSAGGLSGYHRFGSARPYFGTQSRVSSSGTDGRVMLTSDTSRLFGVGSGGTVLLGGGAVMSVDSWPTGANPQRHHFVESFGTSITAGGGNVRVTFPNSGFSAIPVVTATPFSNGTTAAMVAISESRTTDFVVLGWADASGTSITLMTLAAVPFAWRASGVKAL